MKDVLILLACVLYVLSPIDLVPEALVGPFGLPDDVLAGLIGLRSLVRCVWPPSTPQPLE